MESSRQVWKWLREKVGIANLILLLLIAPITVWIAIHEWRLGQQQEQQNQQFKDSLDSFYKIASQNSANIADIEQSREGSDALIAALKEMNGNIRSMSDMIKADHDRAVSVPVRTPETRTITRPRTSPCPQRIEVQRVQRVGTEILILKDTIPNPNLQECLDAQKKKLKRTQ